MQRSSTLKRRNKSCKESDYCRRKRTNNKSWLTTWSALIPWTYKVRVLIAYGSTQSPSLLDISEGSLRNEVKHLNYFIIWLLRKANTNAKILFHERRKTMLSSNLFKEGQLSGREVQKAIQINTKNWKRGWKLKQYYTKTGKKWREKKVRQDYMPGICPVNVSWILHKGKKGVSIKRFFTQDFFP